VSGRLPVPLSVLDLCPVPTGESAGEALRRSVDLAQHAERWGMRRYWVAEHHGMPGIASSAPAVLAGPGEQQASLESLPPVVAEQFVHAGRPGHAGVPAEGLR
jgi:hypothetical protein